MAQKNKTVETAVSVEDFIESFVASEPKKSESYQLMALMKEWSGFEPKMWGPSIIGFGSHHYKYESGHEGDMPLIAFSPRKAAFSLYVYTFSEESKVLLTKLGKYKMGKACIYVNKLADIDLEVLEKLCKTAIEHLKVNPNSVC
ncbi:DUF1801 domain-containing protein [Algoriphagus aestuarii]|nr:DUF1801 domain-containing protein [Algoriphagus aestuarii]